MAIAQQPIAASDRRRFARHAANLLINVRHLSRSEFQHVLEARNYWSDTNAVHHVPIDGLALQTEDVLNTLPDASAAPPAFRLHVREQLQQLAHDQHHADTVADDNNVDLSLSGLAFNGTSNHKAGTALEVALTSRTKALRLVVLGIVVYCRPCADENCGRSWHTAVDFVDLHPDEREILAQLLS